MKYSIAFVGFRINYFGILQRTFFPGIQTDSNLFGNGASDLILKRQCIAQVTLIALGPEVLVRRSLDELCGDPNPVAGTKHGPFHDGIHS